LHDAQRFGIAAGGAFYNAQPEQQLGFVLKMKLRTFVWLYSFSRQLLHNSELKSNAYWSAPLAAIFLLGVLAVTLKLFHFFFHSSIDKKCIYYFS
jgi:hypothetical protein